jgi:hypothetical protein
MQGTSIEAALGRVFGVDRQLISDGTYFIVEDSGHVVGCGGWSRRRAVFDTDFERASEDAALDPACALPASVPSSFIPIGHGAALVAPFFPPVSLLSAPQGSAAQFSWPHFQASRCMLRSAIPFSSVTSFLIFLR